MLRKRVATGRTEDRAARVEEFSEDNLPPAGQNEEVYLDYLTSLQGTFERWGRSKGWISWLQGQALNRLTESIRRKVCERGAYGRVLEEIGMRTTTAWYCRQIAAQCTATEARSLGYLEMLRRIGVTKESVRKPPRKRPRTRFIQLIEAFCKYLGSMALRRECAQMNHGDCRLAIDHLAAITQAAEAAIVELEMRRRGFRLHVAEDVDGDKGTASEAV
jgi:hypothetical protein